MNSNTYAIDLHTQYQVECWRDGKLAWAEDFHNLVTTVGKNKILDACFKTGEGANQWFIGLVSNTAFTGYAATDTMSTHPGWTEGSPYSNATRPAFTPSVPSNASMDNRASHAVFNINATATIRGAFLVDNSSKGGSSGTLYGVGDFLISTRLVMLGDVLNVSVTITA
jgi:hypothetical protein